LLSANTQAPTSEELERLLSPRELSRVLGLSLSTTYALLNDGQLPTYRIGRLRKVRQQDVDAFVQSRRERP
jgi:excisionase family DNA binding protein